MPYENKTHLKTDILWHNTWQDKKYEILSQNIPFLGTMVYADRENNLQTTPYTGKLLTSNLIFILDQNILVH